MRIKIIGEAGQGIKTLSLILGNIFAELNKRVSISINYGTNVRSGIITTDLIYSQDKIKNPKIITPDLLVTLANGDNIKYDGPRISHQDIDFELLSFQNFKKTRFANMIALGKLLKFLDIDLEDISWDDKIPKKYYDKNMKSIKIGYAL